MSVTPRDKEMVPGFEPATARVLPIRVFLAAAPRSPAAHKYQEIVTSRTREVLGSISGIVIVDRSQTESILKELAFQQTGLTDSDGIARIGRFTNASHLFLASLADLTIEKTYHPSTVIGNKRVPAYYEYNVLSAIDVQVIEVETAEIVYSESIEGVFNQGSRVQLDSRSERSLVLKSLENCFEDMRPRIQQSLPLRTVIIAMRGNREIALIPAGRNYGVQTGARFDILSSITQRTAVGNRTFTETVGELEIFSVHADTAWGMISGNEDKIKIGSAVRLKPQPISSWRSVERWFNRNFTSIN